MAESRGPRLLWGRARRCAGAVQLCGADASLTIPPLLATLTEDVLQGRLIHVPIPRLDMCAFSHKVWGTL